VVGAEKEGGGWSSADEVDAVASLRLLNPFPLNILSRSNICSEGIVMDDELLW